MGKKFQKKWGKNSRRKKKLPVALEPYSEKNFPKEWGLTEEKTFGKSKTFIHFSPTDTVLPLTKSNPTACVKKKPLPAPPPPPPPQINNEQWNFVRKFTVT